VDLGADGERAAGLPRGAMQAAISRKFRHAQDDVIGYWAARENIGNERAGFADLIRACREYMLTLAGRRGHDGRACGSGSHGRSFRGGVALLLL
jgi:hypothetical protein